MTYGVPMQTILHRNGTISSQKSENVIKNANIENINSKSSSNWFKSVIIIIWNKTCYNKTLAKNRFDKSEKKIDVEEMVEKADQRQFL